MFKALKTFKTLFLWLSNQSNNYDFILSQIVIDAFVVQGSVQGDITFFSWDVHKTVDKNCLFVHLETYHSYYETGWENKFLLTFLGQTFCLGITDISARDFPK